MARAIMVYLRKSILYLVPLARVPSGGHIETDPIEVVEMPVSAEVLESRIFKSLASSDQLVPDPPLAELSSPAQKASDAKTWRQFIKQTVACDLEQNESGFMITPLKPDRGPGFFDEPDKAVQVPLNAASGALVEKLLEMLNNCEPH